MESNEQNKLTYKIKPDACYRLKVTRGVGGGVQWWKEREGTRERTCVNDPQTWTTVWEFCGSGAWEAGCAE